MINGMHQLVDIRSKTFQGIAIRIRPLEYSEYLTTIYDVESQTIYLDSGFRFF